MVSQDHERELFAVINALRKLTKITRAFPFVYLAIYAIYLGISPFVNGNVLSAFDVCICCTVWFDVIILLYSKILKLCWWHKTACAVPFISFLVNIFDCVLLQMTYEEVVVFNLSVCAWSVCFLTASIIHFRNVRRRVHK